jgi:WhiB family redox-sensing transcriptional regulator
MASPRTSRNPTTRQSPAKDQTAPALPIAAIFRWMDSAACADADPDIFAGATSEDAAEAKAICAGCTVRPQCRDYALATGQEWGVWGGLSEAERKALLEQQDDAASAGIGGAA